ncbi:MAG: hypothetical protein AAF996_04790 [Pseudomonadota bacterium]
MIEALENLRQFLAPIGGWNFIYFVLEIVITYLIVRVVLSVTEQRNWRRFRQNYAQNLLDRTVEIAKFYKDGLKNFEPFRSELDSQNASAQTTHYQLETGTALRRFDASVRAKRNEIRQSMEIGFVGISANLSETVSDYQIVLDALVDLTSLLVQADDASGLPELNDNEKRNLRRLKQALFSEERIPNKMMGTVDSACAPFSKLTSHILNFGFCVSYAHHKSFAGALRRYGRLVVRFLFPVLARKQNSSVRETVLFARSRKTKIDQEMNTFDGLTRESEAIDTALKSVLESLDI